MSLQVWLPLIGNTKNQGLLGDVLNISNVTYTTGKLGGQALNTGNIQLPANQTVNVLNNNAISIALWIYIDKDAGSSGNTMFFGTDSMNSTYGRRFAIFNYPTSNDLHWHWQQSINGTVSNVSIGVINGIIPTREWVHICMTYQNPTIKWYINGELKNTSNGIYKADDFNFVCQLIHDSNTHRVQDFRLYDHCLSAKEVKIISQGLILHYPLNDKRSLKNLKKNVTYGVYNNFSASGTTGSLIKLDEKYHGCDIYRLTMIPDSTRIDSFKTTLHSHGISGFGQTFKANTKYCFWIYYRPVTHLDIRVGGVASNIGGWAEIPPQKYDNEWYIVGQYRTGSVTENKTDSIYTSFCTPSAEANVPISIDFCCPHLIEGSQEILDDGDYQEIVDKSIVYDTSGYCNNGIILNILSTSTNTPKYDYSTHFTATNQKIKIDNLSTVGFNNSYSFAWWGKCNTWSNKMHWGFTNGIRLNGIYNGILWNTGDGASNPLYNIGTTTQVTAPDTNWHHWVMTGNGTKSYVYKDGVLWAEAKMYKAISGTTIYINGWDSGTAYSLDDLYISDFRIYATALSAEDVAELCSVGASIDNKGNIFTYQLEEG